MLDRREAIKVIGATTVATLCGLGVDGNNRRWAAISRKRWTLFAAESALRL